MTEVIFDISARAQFIPYLNRKQRWAAIVAHRRAGKTVGCIQDLIARAAVNKRPEPQYSYVGPTFSQAKDIAWRYLKRYTSGVPGIDIRESELSVRLPHNGARVRLYGAENYDRMRGIYNDGVVLDEPADIDPRAWPEVIRPTLSDRGGWATFIGTPKGHDAFERICKTARNSDDWFFMELRASQTGLLSEAELADAKRMLTPEQYAQEYECSFDAAVRGAYYAKDIAEAEREGRVRNVPLDKAADVFAAWDLGIGDALAIWIFQIIGAEWHFLRYYENANFGLDHYVDWIKTLPFAVHEHILPHDATARELQTGNDRVTFLENRGLKCRVLKRHAIEDRINAVRVKFNRMYFDAEGTELGVEMLRTYRAEYSEKNQVLSNRPKHDWTSHAADAFGYAVMGGAEPRRREPIPEVNTRWVV